MERNVLNQKFLPSHVRDAIISAKTKPKPQKEMEHCHDMLQISLTDENIEGLECNDKAVRLQTDTLLPTNFIQTGNIIDNDDQETKTNNVKITTSSVYNKTTIVGTDILENDNSVTTISEVSVCRKHTADCKEVHVCKEKAVKQDFSHMLQSKNRPVVEGLTAHCNENLKHFHSSHFKNPTSEIIEENKSAYNVSKENICSLETVFDVCNQETNIHHTQLHSSLASEKVNNISNITCNKNMDINCAFNAAMKDTDMKRSNLAAAIRNVRTKNKTECSSVLKDTCEKNALLSLNKEIKSTSVITNTEKCTCMSTVSPAEGADTRNNCLALDVENADMSNNKKGFGSLQNRPLTNSCKNHLLISDKTEENTDTSHTESSIENAEILPNESNNKSVQHKNEVSNISCISEAVANLKQLAVTEPPSCDISSHCNSAPSTSRSLCECGEYQNSKDKKSATSSEREILESNYSLIDTNGIKINSNFELMNVPNIPCAEEDITMPNNPINSSVLKNDSPSIQDATFPSSIQETIENGPSENKTDQKLHKATSVDSAAQHKTKKTGTLQSLFDIKVSNYLFPKSEEIFSSKLDVFDGIVWEKAHIKRALYHGHQIIPPMETVASGPFTISIVNRLQDLNFQKPTCIQSLVWPAMFRGHNVVEVAPARSGKSLAYLLPILSQLTNKGQYDEFIGSDGPLAVILCSNWKKAQTVYNQCKLLLQNCDVDVNVVYNRGCGMSQKIALLNGCKILITIPSCYLHFHKEDKRIVNLDHCCHLVFDDADKVIDKFLIDVSEIMNQFANAVCYRKDSFLPNQIVLSSENWSKLLSSFVYNCIPDPLVILMSFDEAAIYSQVPTFCHIHSVSTPSKLLKLVSACESKRIVICTCSVETAIQIYERLFSMAPKTLMAHGDLTQRELSKVTDEWNHYSKTEAAMILVCTDDVILQLDIKNANCLVHYDLPKLPNFRFGLRYSLMVSNFSTLEKTFSHNASDCVSHIFITKNCQAISYNLLKFLKQLPCEIPDILTSLTENFRKENEYKNAHICHCFKAYGFCPSHRICSYRHRIDSDLDSTTYVPRYGWVKIFITNVIDATHYYARIMEHSDSSCALNCVSYLSLSLKISDYYSIATNCIRPSEIKTHTLYAFQKTDSTFHRVWVLHISSYDTAANPQTLFIHYVDEGWCEEIIAEKLYILPPYLARFPAQAIEVYACSVQPIDKYYEWTPQANMLIHNTINGKEVEGKVVLGLRNTLWLEPIVYYVQIEISNVTVVQAVISDIIVRKELGIKNPDHLPNLYSACDGVIDLPEFEISSESHKQEHAFLELNKFHDVYIYSVHNPGLFFVQRTDFIECMDFVSDKLDKMIRKGTLKKPKRILKDMICAAPFGNENSWFRATVNYVDVNSGQVDLFFVDYGDTNVAKIKDIYCIPSELLLLPFQAIECSLAGVVPCGRNWTSEAGKLLYDLSCSETITTKMVVKALKSESSCFRIGKRYIVQLWDTTSDYDIYAADELIKQGVALPCTLPDSFDVENDQRILLKQSEIDALLSEEENSEKAFLAAVVYGQINEKIDKLIANVNNNNKTAECDDSETHLLPGSDDNLAIGVADNSSKCVIPKIQWCQTDSTITIQISIANLKTYEMNIIGLNVCFVATVNSCIYRFEEELFDVVQSNTCDVKTTSTSTLFTFTKEEIGKWWPQLTKATNENIKLITGNGEKNILEDDETSKEVPVVKWNSDEILPYDPLDEYEKENLSEDDVPWEQVCLPLDPYDMLCWD